MRRHGSVSRWVISLWAVVLVGSAAWSASAANRDIRTKVLIGFRTRPDPSVVAAVGGRVDHVYTLVPALAAEVPESKLAALRGYAGVLYVEPDYPVYALETAPPAETLSPWPTVQLVALFDPGTETLPWGIARIGAPAVWAGIPGEVPPNWGEGVRVGIIDTGIDYTHPDLAGSYVLGYDFVSDDWDPLDDNGHGTHVAGIIAAADDGPNSGGGNTTGTSVVGVGPQVSLYIAKCLDAQGTGSTSDIVAAINLAATHGVDVVNMSFGSPFSSTTLKKACDRAYSAGVLLVAAAGNESASWLDVPARFGSVVSVGAVDSSDVRASFSNYSSALELCAPGVGVLSCMPTYSVTLTGPTYGYQQIYDYLSGTSMACPHVVGAAALVWAAHPAWTNAQVRQQLNSTAEDLGAAGRDKYYGYGLVDAAAGAM